MKRILLATVAALAVSAGSAQAQTVFDGFYAGIGLGDELLQTRLSGSRTASSSGVIGGPITVNTHASRDTHAFTGRLFAGYNMTFDRWLVGAETSWRPTIQNQNGVNMGLTGERVSFRSPSGVFTASVRAGYLARPDLLVYGFAGWRGEQSDITISAAGLPSERSRRFMHGLIAGAGFEYALTNAWFVRAEYEYGMAGSYNVGWRTEQALVGGNLSVNNRLRSEPERHAFTIGFGYRF
jgi:opacity protein-like surface antigen